MPSGPPVDAKVVEEILKYLKGNGYQMMSFERIRNLLGREDLTDERCRQVVRQNPSIFRLATLKEKLPALKGNKPGLAKVIP